MIFFAEICETIPLRFHGEFLETFPVRFFQRIFERISIGIREKKILKESLEAFQKKKLS